MPDSSEGLQTKGAISRRILALEGLVDDILGHASARTPDGNQMWIRCRSENEQGVCCTTADSPTSQLDLQ
jgi:3,4-dihydroxyphthalate decarboxylase